MEYEYLYQIPIFKIEDNILKGDPKPYAMKTHNLGKTILDVLNSNLDHVSQVFISLNVGSNIML